MRKGDCRPDEAFALRLDEQDPLASFRSRFHLPRREDGTGVVYFAGNSLGLQPVGVAGAVGQELQDWARLGVDGHFDGKTPWYSYHRGLAEPMARLVGALPSEVVVMNGLTVNLHLLMVSFYRPASGRYKILMEDCAFPSDTYAVKSQLRFHGHDPEEALIVAGACDGHAAVRTEDLERCLEQKGSEIALVLLGGVNYYTGCAFDLERITELAHDRGCVVGIDLAHAAGNLPLQLHDWDVDFAVWCTYKYLNGGPGAVAAAFVHERLTRSLDLPRFAGWWGNDPKTRFRMHLEPEFKPLPSADGWQISNPPVLAMAPLRVALRVFDEAGMQALRAKSIALTGFLEYWIDLAAPRRIEMLTPRQADRRGCQISMRALERPRELFEVLKDAGVVGDFREPDVTRVAPVPLYNTYHDVWRFGQAIKHWAGD